MTIELSIPTSLNDIELQQYQRYLSIAKDSKDTEFLTHKMIEIFCGVELKSVMHLKYTDSQEIINTISNCFLETPKFQNRFVLGETEFGFIPNLEDIKLEEFADLDGYINDFDNLHKAMAVLYRPITKKIKDKYEIEPYQGSNSYADVMRFIPLNIAIGAQVFFYNLKKELLLSTLSYLENNKELQNILDKHNSEKNGDGIHLSIHSLKETFSNLMKSEKLDFPLL